MSQEHPSTAPAQAESNLDYSREAVRGAVVVGYDGSEHARRALEWAIREARLRDATLVPAVVVPALAGYGVPELPNDTALAAAEQLLTEAAQTAREQQPRVRTTPIRVVGPPAQGLLQFTEDAQLIVVGSRGRGGVASMILGSVSLRVAQRAACPAVVVPPESHSQTTTASSSASTGRLSRKQPCPSRSPRPCCGRPLSSSCTPSPTPT